MKKKVKKKVNLRNIKFHSDDLGIVEASVDSIQGRLHIDSWSNLNLVSIALMNSLPGTNEQVSICTGRIYEALLIALLRTPLWFVLWFQLCNYTFTSDFCIKDQKDICFEFLLGFRSIANNYLFHLSNVKIVVSLLLLMKSLISLFLLLKTKTLIGIPVL